MDYKEKYEQALEKVKVMLGTGDYTRESLEYVFPELAESEDERIRKRIIDLIKEIGDDESYHVYHLNDMLTWLEKQSEQKPAEWSEEDEEISSAIVKRLEGSCALSVDLQSAICWVENVKDRVQQQPKQEWSEEDVAMLDSAIAFVEHSAFTTIGKGKNNVIAWLKNLKDRYTWKPSDEQMEALKEACDEHWEPDGLDPLYTLYQDLKKLKG